jgi:cystathionine gamma-synthase
MSSLILKFPPNFVRQLSTKARRNCSNIGVAQIVAASWSNNSAAGAPSAAAAAAAAAAASAIPAADPAATLAGNEVAGIDSSDNKNVSVVQLEDLSSDLEYKSFLSSDGSIAVHAGKHSNLISLFFF